MCKSLRLLIVLPASPHFGKSQKWNKCNGESVNRVIMRQQALPAIGTARGGGGGRWRWRCRWRRVAAAAESHGAPHAACEVSGAVWCRNGANNLMIFIISQSTCCRWTLVPDAISNKPYLSPNPLSCCQPL